MMSPLTKRRWQKFRKQKRAYFSLILISACFILSLFAEFICNNKPFLVKYEGNFYFPMFKHYQPALFGDTVNALTDYREVQKRVKEERKDGWFLFPIIPYSANESMNDLAGPPPTAPTRLNWLGTDDRGRDLLSRLLYGFRNSMLFALVSWFFIVLIAYVTGAIQGFFGGYIDFWGQRLSEIWNALPVLYVIIFLISIFPSSLVLLILVWVAFSWLSLSSYVRAEVLRIRKQDYIVAAKALGAGNTRILFRHILPNSLTPLITFSPFLVSASIGSLAALDYLGLGLPPPTASWGELLHQGKENLTSWWLSLFPFLCLFGSLLLLSFVGEGVRSAFDSREA